MDSIIINDIIRQLERYGPIERKSITTGSASKTRLVHWTARTDLLKRPHSHDFDVITGHIAYNPNDIFITITTYYEGSNTKERDGFQETRTITIDEDKPTAKIVFGVVREHILKAFDRETTSVEKYLTYLEREVTGV